MIPDWLIGVAIIAIVWNAWDIHRIKSKLKDLDDVYEENGEY